MLRPLALLVAFVVAAPLVPTAAAQGAPRTRSMDDLNWMECAELVPARHRTVILTVGTLEPHGVVKNGADNTAPTRGRSTSRTTPSAGTSARCSTVSRPTSSVTSSS